ncbi:hypothetical protein KL928_003488 [Ogataea angusta]|uniref:Uncharacterized protein n=1 Tax=Pichia angusta TaxID=870730 RepID=A0AAN6DDE1_PICAN|nr:uncharacterized protein KL928_003488 [Ogataea angusta]KAG7817589.1 hypothetical protein KL928_003488 [Ogataea angusta]
MKKTSLSSLDSRTTIPRTREQYEYLAKLVLIGSFGSGKSSLLHRYVSRDWRAVAQTIGVGFASQVAVVDGSTRVKLQIWDTAGQERFRALTRSYYRGASGVVVVFDLSSRPSFDAVSEFMQDVKNMTPPDSCVLLVGNKNDLSKAVSKSDIADLVDSSSVLLGRPVQFVATSALDNSNVDTVFETVAGSLVTKIELGQIDPEDPASGVQYGDLSYDAITLATPTPRECC